MPRGIPADKLPLEFPYVTTGTDIEGNSFYALIYFGYDMHEDGGKYPNLKRGNYPNLKLTNKQFLSLYVQIQEELAIN